jgi:hypothetical protein
MCVTTSLTVQPAAALGIAHSLSPSEPASADTSPIVACIPAIPS